MGGVHVPEVFIVSGWFIEWASFHWMFSDIYFPKGPQRYEQARIHICHHCPFYRVRRFLSKERGGRHQGTFPSVSQRWCFLKSESLNNKNSSPKNTHIQSSFSARAFKSSPKSHRSKYKQNIRPKRMTWKIPHRPCWQNKMALKSWRRY